MADVDATIAVLAAAPTQTALLLDFDGSLAPIVERAPDARPLPQAHDVLARLAARLGRVAIVSGRPVAFLAEHMSVERVELVGLYGMERVIDGERIVDPRVAPYLGAIEAAASALAGYGHELVENKSGVAITVHWRVAPEREPELSDLAYEVARLNGLTPVPSRMAVELRPPVPIDKGSTTRELVDGFATAAFAGDDTGDLPAFAALRAAQSEGTLERVVRIGVLSDEAPAQLRDAVDLVVDGPDGLLRLLTRVADEIG